MTVVRDMHMPAEKGGKPGNQPDPLDMAMDQFDLQLVREGKRAQIQQKVMESKLGIERTKRELQDMEDAARIQAPQRPLLPSSALTSQPASMKEEVAFGKLLVDMVQNQQMATRAAEAAKTDAEQARWASEEKRLGSIIDNFRQERAQLLTQPKEAADPMDIYKRYRAMLDEVKGELAKELPKGPMGDGLTPLHVQIEESRMRHEETMMQIQHQNQLLLQQMQQNHEIAMEEARTGRLKLEVEITALKQKKVERQDAWTDTIGSIGRTIGDVINENRGGEFTPGPGVGEAAVRRGPRLQTAAGLHIQECVRCGFNMPVPPEIMERGGQFECPKCTQVYKVDAPPGSNEPPPPPQAPGGPKESVNEDIGGWPTGSSDANPGDTGTGELRFAGDSEPPA